MAGPRDVAPQGSSHPVRHVPVPLAQGTGLAMQHHATVVQTRPPGASGALVVSPDYPALKPYAACLIAQRCLGEAGAGDESLWRAACALVCEMFFGRFHIDPATGLQVGHETVLVQWRRGRISWSGRPPCSEARPLHPKTAMDWCWWECELTRDLAWKPCRSTT